MRCAQCSKESDATRLPSGWKRIGDSVWCSKCFRKRYVLRAITFPIVGPVCTHKPGNPKSEPLDWPGFRALLRTSWIAMTQASNLVIRTLALNDPGIADGKFLPLPKLNLYEIIKNRWPEDLARRSVAVMTYTARSRYCKMRRLYLTYQISLPTMRYPVPLPVQNHTWEVWEDPGGRLLLSFPLGPTRITARLRGGYKQRRQLVAARKIISGDAIKAELDIGRTRANRGDHRTGDTRGTRVMAKLMGWFPREETRGGNIAAGHTGGDAFLTLYDENKRCILRWNQDHVRRRVVKHDDNLQRLREDLKAESRVRRNREPILARMRLISRKQNHYLHTFCHTLSKSVVELLRRRRCGTFLYVDHDQSYVRHFPWYKLAAMLEQKCEMAGIEFIASAPESKEPREVEVST